MSRPPYLSPDVDEATRVEDLIGRMTLAEKAGMLFHTAVTIGSGGSPVMDDDPDNAQVATPTLILDKHINHLHIWNGDTAGEVATWHNTIQEMAEATRLGIPVTVATDPRHGLRSTPFTGLASGAVSRWPEHTGLGAIGDPRVAQAYGDVVRRELSAMGIRVYLGPMADLFTDPRWSRGFGTFGESPELVSQLTHAFIQGLMGGDRLGPESVAAVVKHFPGGGPQLGGMDAHDSAHREQVYPGGEQETHLRPFEAAFAAGATQVMPYYGMPVGTDWEEVGFAFNAPVITGLLRDRYAFDGIVCTDWFLLESAKVGGLDFGPNGYGLEHLSAAERIEVALAAGVDQFGGDHCTHLVSELVGSGRLSEERLDLSVRRLLREKFRLGLFDNRRVDVDGATSTVGSVANRAQGHQAQVSSLVLLKEPGRDREVKSALPLARGLRIYAEGVAPGFSQDLEPYGHRVDDAEQADVALLRLDCPWSPSGSPLGDLLHSGSLEFSSDVTERIASLSARLPTVVVVYLERPAILTPLLDEASALIGDFGADDRAVLETLFGVSPFTGRLPFDLPSSQEAVDSGREDVPFDTKAPLFRFGHGIVTTGRRAYAPGSRSSG